MNFLDNILFNLITKIVNNRNETTYPCINYKNGCMDRAAMKILSCTRSSRTVKLSALLWMACVAGILVGCGDEALTRPEIEQQFIKENMAARTVQTDTGGTITIAGSTAMEKFANMLAEQFMEEHPDVTVTVEFTGSSAGIEAVLAGRVEIGNSSRYLKEEEKAAGAVENIIAIDGIVVIVNPSNPVHELTKEELVDIYTGRIRNWNEAGGDDEAIVVVGREAGSGTRQAFEEFLGTESACVYANEMDSCGAVAGRVAATKGAVGYVSFDIPDHTVCGIAIDGVSPVVENIRNGSYRMSRPFVMATRGEISAQTKEVQELFAYIRSDEGHRLMKAAGLVVPEY